MRLFDPKKAFSPAVFTPIDTTLWIAVFALASAGLVMVYSASFIQAKELHHDGLYFLKRHLLFLGAGTSAFLLCWRLPTKTFRKLAVPLYVLSLIGLALTFVPGISHRAGGAARWLTFWGLTFQPSEFAKLATLLFLSRQIERKITFQHNFRSGFLAYFVPVFPVYVLLLQQPDFGTTALIVCTTFCMILAAGVKFRYLAAFAGMLLPTGIILVLSAPYRVKRFLGFLDPWADPTHKGFQIIQSLIAFSSGKWFGVGVGNSHEKLFYLPMAHNDFIFAVVGEEWGLFGVVFFVGLFLTIVWRGLQAGIQAVHHPFERALAVGLSCMIGLQAFFNMGVVLGLLPTKGLPLPLISYGGSSLVITLAALGLLVRLSEDHN